MHLNTFAQLLSSAMSNGVEQKLSAGSESLKLSHLFSESAAQMENRWDGSITGPCSVPCFQLKGHLSGSNQVQNNNISLLDVAALNLSTPIYTNISNIDSVPSQILANVTASMKQLLTSRLRASMIALIKQTTKLGDYKEADVLRRLLLSKKSIDIVTVVTSFTVINDESGVTGCLTKPIILDAIIDISMLGKMNTVTLQVPGTVNAVISPSEFLFDSVHVTFDTVCFLKTMMEEVRLLIKKTLKRAAKITAAYSQMKLKRSRVQFEEERRPEEVRKESKPAAQSSTEQDLSSYPEHFRETVRQFLPTEETVIEANIEGFPPQLARTLKLLAKGGGDEEEYSSGNENDKAHNDVDFSRFANDGVSEGCSSWMNGPSRDSARSFSSLNNFSNPRPLKKRRTKVSFSLPHGH
mmetsp:Transcript_7798/g.11709  ORF Transcript_7798/g.11709 Transcript_7798/m.11709 type:complete len:410 (+) Transcript_7798:40-1269(+)